MKSYLAALKKGKRASFTVFEKDLLDSTNHFENLKQDVKQLIMEGKEIPLS